MKENRILRTLCPGGVIVNHSIWMLFCLAREERETEISQAWFSVRCHEALVKTECAKILYPSGQVGLPASVSLQRSNLGMEGAWLEAWEFVLSWPNQQPFH